MLIAMSIDCCQRPMSPNYEGSKYVRYVIDQFATTENDMSLIKIYIANVYQRPTYKHSALGLALSTIKLNITQFSKSELCFPSVILLQILINFEIEIIRLAQNEN